ncbi:MULTISPECIES: chitooligosaccharide deacetylase NodB [unclassified Sinorhizobium]|uniref:chitooligosaccharide deacetylase NodB n=1 Tax=unclassified Sinorhizobium TaxID=2613772 RepID=UPI0024C27159|nr:MULTISPECIES: chitooligosaccharide deacetylase NodB [unclassified Sinorhizobium]MDK1376366.1 chitooligosaccharide deacetylase NodB [Sinorhizobium sp. 6-70]MDK1482368.1 chitooligosaccharide deacetylase NodB [Sinorhizobium sp. 6-117]
MTHVNCFSEMHSGCTDSTGQHSVYLTFDDGPHPFCTPEILDVLAEHRVPATFFVIGQYAADQPKLIQRMIAEGHDVANHTMTHPDLSKCTPGEIQREILEANRAITMASARASVRHIRAPYGSWTEEVLTASAAAGLNAIHWSVDPRDWSCPGVDAIVDEVLDSVQPGAIVLLHDGCPPSELQPGTDRGLRYQTIMALSSIIPSLQSRGFVFRSLPQDH